MASSKRNNIGASAPRPHVIRMLDIVLLLLTLPVWVPVLAITAIVVACTEGRPVLFRQIRVGRDGRTFVMLKFRSMVSGDNPLVPDPSRITPIGRILRRTSLDELPQLLNVARGDMSFVGPRPMLTSQVAEMPAELDRRRHGVRPGLTGLAQVRGRNQLSWDERFDHDIEWAERPTIRRYLGTLRRTVRVLLMGVGVSGHDPSDPYTLGEPNIVRLVDFDLTERAAERSTPPSKVA